MTVTATGCSTINIKINTKIIKTGSDMSRYSEELADITNYNALDLANMAGIRTSPPDRDSLAAKWLVRLRDEFVRRTDVTGPGVLPDPDTFRAAVEETVPVANHERWQVFTDLALWTEDTADHGADVASDMTDAATMIMIGVGIRLMDELREALHDAAAQDVQDDDETGDVA